MNELEVFDAHIHVIDHNFPVFPNSGFLPEPFTISDYHSTMNQAHYDSPKQVKVIGGAVVSGSFQKDDQTYLEKALPELQRTSSIQGKNIRHNDLGSRWVGVTQLPTVFSDEQIIHLDEVGVRAIRFNLARGPYTDLDQLIEQAHRVYSVARWHTEVYVSARELTELGPRLLTLPQVSIDHLGMDEEGLPELLRLVDKGIRVKATGFGRLNFDIPTVLREIYTRNPHALMFGTDLPGTRAPRAYQGDDLHMVINTLGEHYGIAAVHAVLANNALDWYRCSARQNTE